MSGIDPDSGETELEPPVKEANEAEPELQPEQSNRGNEAVKQASLGQKAAPTFWSNSLERPISFAHATMLRTPT